MQNQSHLQWPIELKWAKNTWKYDNYANSTSIGHCRWQHLLDHLIPFCQNELIGPGDAAIYKEQAKEYFLKPKNDATTAAHSAFWYPLGGMLQQYWVVWGYIQALPLNKLFKLRHLEIANGTLLFKNVIACNLYRKMIS